MANDVIQSLILRQLARREMEVLSIVAAVGRVVTPADRVKGDLTTVVKAGLRALVASKAVLDHDGRYSLSSSTRA